MTMIKQNMKKDSIISTIIQQLICPITNEIMSDPVIIQTGHTFDRESIQSWFLRGHKTNPLTGLILKTTKIYPNICARNMLFKIPVVERNIQKNKIQMERLFVALQKIWNQENHLQNQQYKQQIKRKGQQKFIQKLQYQLRLQQNNQKIDYLQKTNQTLRQLLKRQANFRKKQQEKNQFLLKQIKQLKELKNLSQFQTPKFGHIRQRKNYLTQTQISFKSKSLQREKTDSSLKNKLFSQQTDRISSSAQKKQKQNVYIYGQSFKINSIQDLQSIQNHEAKINSIIKKPGLLYKFRYSKSDQNVEKKEPTGRTVKYLKLRKISAK